MHNAGHFSMLGLGDIVMPGLLLCFVLRYDSYKKSQNTISAEAGVPPPKSMLTSRLTYFHCSLVGWEFRNFQKIYLDDNIFFCLISYFLGLLTATVSSEVFKQAQPALLYLVPFTLLPLLSMAYVRGDLRRMWTEPFQNGTGISKQLEV